MNPPDTRPHRSPCTGLRVIEFTHMVMGPTCGMVLADMGAEVIKIEPVDGDRTRRLLGAGAGFFPMFNRNKKSIGIDLHSEEGAETARAPLRHGRRGGRELQAGHHGQVRPGLREPQQGEPAPDLRQPQGLPARARTTTAPRWTKWCR